MINRQMMNRVKAMLNERDMSQASFARSIEVSPQTLSGWFSGRNSPNVEAVVKMCDSLQVSPSWLLTGREDSVAHQSLVTEDTVCIPLFEVEASCGNGSYGNNSVFLKLIEVNKLWVIRYCGSANMKSLNIIMIHGDSMAPTIKDGDFVIVDISVKKPYTDAMFAFLMDDDLFVKRFQRIGANYKIISDNPLYPTLELSPAQLEEANFRVVGKIVTTCKLTPV